MAVAQTWPVQLIRSASQRFTAWSRSNLTTRDGLTLAGYKLAAVNPTAYLLVAQGNAMLADQLIADLQTFRDHGWDVYIYDYRGYGNSQGKSRLAAIVDDYGEIVAHLNTQGYKQRLLYGISMGGVILLNAVGKTDLYTRLVVDSSPARISHLGCPEQYDPVAHLPNDGARVMIISGARDRVVSPDQMDELLRSARSRGARILQDAEFAHPYQDSSMAIHRRRQHEVATFSSIKSERIHAPPTTSQSGDIHNQQIEYLPLANSWQNCGMRSSSRLTILPMGSSTLTS